MLIEEPLRPDLIVHTDVGDLSTAAQRIVFLVQRLCRSLAIPIETP